MCISDTSTSNLTTVSTLLKMPDDDGDGPTASTSQSITCERKLNAFDVLLMDEKALVAALQGATAPSDANSDAQSIPEEVGSDGRDAVSVDWDELPRCLCGLAAQIESTVPRSTSRCFWGLWALLIAVTQG
jgi:hypothetical protein